MRSWNALSSVLVAVAVMAASCSDDPASPGSIAARWDLTPGDCQELRLDKIEARALRGEVVEAVSAAETCATTGSVTIPEVPPGTYTVRIDGLNVDGRATHTASEENVRVSEGDTASTRELRLVKKPARMHVRWSFADGFGCVDNGTSEVRVEIFKDGTTLETETTVACDATFIDDQDEDTEKTGVLFDAIVSETKLDILVTGFDDENPPNAVHEGQEEVTPLAGESRRVDVRLDPAP